MKYIIVSFLLFLAACEARNFDSDRRQIIAKDQVSRHFRGNRSFTITGFHEDTLHAWPDSAITHPLRYTLDFIYNDSVGNKQSKKAVVIFTPEGNAVLNTEIVDQPLSGN